MAGARSADAATCTSAGGVSVVVDYRELGGSTITACAEDGGGKSAVAVLASVGVGLTYATRQPGFVCRVTGVPTTDPCVNASPADAYWGLWWSDGSAGSWTYSSSGVGSLVVPAGGSVGWSWKQGTGNAVPPGIAPPVAPPSPSATPTASPSTGGGSGGKGGNGGKGGGGGSGPTPSATPSASSSGSPSSSPSSSPSASPSTSPSASPSESPSESPLAPESPGDSTPGDEPDGASEDPSASPGSPSDPAGSAGSATTTDPESAGDSGADSPSADQPDQPDKVPAAVTWSVVGLLALALAGSAVVARRRRGPDGP